MKSGYFFWGHLGDKLTDKTKNTPDGNAFYSSSIITELLKHGEVTLLGTDRDDWDFGEYGYSIFNSFENRLRFNAYKDAKYMKWDDTWHADYPELDVLLLEWRFKIEGRNHPFAVFKDDFQPDLLMQHRLLEHYLANTNTPIIIFDLDYKLTYEDETKLIKTYGSEIMNRVVVFETSNKPKKVLLRRVPVNIPFWMKESILPPTLPVSPYKKLVYIGSRYERDEIIEKHLIPFSKDHPFEVWFYGNWRNYPDKYEELYSELKWRDIQYHNRVGHKDFRQIYGDAAACPLIGKQEYFDRGFVTARIQECLYFGALPIGFAEQYKIEDYLPKRLIVDEDETLEDIVRWLSNIISFEDRDYLRKSVWKNLEFMDVSNFVKVIKEIANGHWKSS